MRIKILFVAIVLILFGFTFVEAAAQQSYNQPPKEILDVLNAANLPIPVVSPDSAWLMLATPRKYPPISDLAEPQLRLAGVRINPKNNAIHNSSYFVTYSLKKIPNGPETPVALPSGARASNLRWNATASLFAFTNMTDTAVELWIGETTSGKVRRIDGVRLNPVLGSVLAWMPDQKTLLVKTVPVERAEMPADSGIPAGPKIEDSSSVVAASSTYESRDLLQTSHDADLFEYYATSRLALVDVVSGSITTIGAPSVFSGVDASPDGKYLLLDRIQRPYSFIRAYYRFPTEVEVWDIKGVKVETLASQPIAEQVPINGVPVGPRDHAWRATAPATIIWAEALDDGDTYKKVPYHDRIMMKPIGSNASELFKTEQRFSGIDWLQTAGRALLTEFDDDKHWFKTFLIDADQPGAAPRTVWSQNADDSYHFPGYPQYRVLPNGRSVVAETNGAIFLYGEGASPEGNRPFLDRLDLNTLKTERLFRSSKKDLESFLEWIDPVKLTFLTQRESPTDPPNVYVRTLGKKLTTAQEGEAKFESTAQKITSVSDPMPQIRTISKRLVKYQRPDGVQLSFTLFLPPGYKEGTRLPTVVWAYPLDYTDPQAAGQVVASPQEFTLIYGADPVLLTLAGYAVLSDAAMPVVGPTETAYDTFIEQVVANAKAAIDKAVELGVTDPERVGVMGHSHGALMTANLLAWSELFRAGVARSGAYNHTLRPFGFQNERRTLYKAKDNYLKLSPLINADKINEPLLLIHGERDANPGTVTLQSEKLFEAIRGVGGTTRLVILPLESHGYSARESIEQTLYEMVTWMDRYVKNAPPRKK